MTNDKNNKLISDREIITPDKNNPAIIKTSTSKKIKDIFIYFGAPVGVVLIIVFLVYQPFSMIRDVGNEVLDLAKAIIEVPGKLIDKSGEALGKIAEKFKTGTIVTEFISYAQKVLKSDKYILVEVKRPFTIKDKIEISQWWGFSKKLKGISVSGIATLSYFINLSGEWRIEYDERSNSVSVLAPALRYTPPQYLASQLNYDFNDLADKDKEKYRNKLLQKLDLELFMISKNEINNYRDSARLQVKNFIDTWFIENAFRESVYKPYVGNVTFRDELADETMKENIPG